MLSAKNIMNRKDAKLKITITLCELCALSEAGGERFCSKERNSA